MNHPANSDGPPGDVEAATLRQRLMPQASIQSLIVLIAASAVIMWLVRAMFIGDFFWAKCVGVVFVTIAGCFVTYAGLFLLAHLFTIVSSPIVEAIESPAHNDLDQSNAEVAKGTDHGTGVG